MLTSNNTYILHITIESEDKRVPLLFKENITAYNYNGAREKVSELFKEGYTAITKDGGEKVIYPPHRILSVQVSQGLSKNV